MFVCLGSVMVPVKILHYLFSDVMMIRYLLFINIQVNFCGHTTQKATLGNQEKCPTEENIPQLVLQVYIV